MEKVSKDSSLEMPSFLKDSALDLLITYEEATLPEKESPKPKKKKQPKVAKEPRGRKKKKTPDPGSNYLVKKDKRSRSSSDEGKKGEVESS